MNVPFDRNYERHFVAMIAALVSIGRIPRSVLELPDLGRGRLSRLCEHLVACRVSVHDLSRVGGPARFNMPFELGLACALAEFLGDHSYVLLEKVPYRLDKTLSDLKGRDPLIHNGSAPRIITCILDVLRSDMAKADPDAVYRLYRILLRHAGTLKRRHRTQDIYTRSIFKQLVAAAVALATDAGFIEP